MTARPPPPARRGIAWPDIVFVGVLVAVLVTVGLNIHANMTAAGLRPGYGFLWQEAGFDLNESLLPYRASDSYLRAMAAGLVNTLRVAVASLLLASTIGVVVGLIGASPSRPARLLAWGYVELFRNLPKIFILLIVFVVAVNGLPPIRNAITLGPVLISNRAIHFPTLADDPRNGWWLLASGLAVLALGALWVRLVGWRQRRTGQRWPVGPVVLGLVVAVPLVLWRVLDAPLGLSWPVATRFSMTGGGVLSLQFMAMVVTLGSYHGAQIAEVIRGGIAAVAAGQSEAAAALGLRGGQINRLVVVPQVLRLIVPPLNNQFANLLKNTSIALAVGYSDLMSVASTAINQTFRPFEIMLLTMAVYLLLVVALTSALGYWGARLRRREGRGA